MRELFYWTGLIICTFIFICVSVYLIEKLLVFFFRHVFKDKTILREVASYAANKKKYKQYLAFKDKDLTTENGERLLDVIFQIIWLDLNIKDEFNLDDISTTIAEESKKKIIAEINYAIECNKQGENYN